MIISVWVYWRIQYRLLPVFDEDQAKLGGLPVFGFAAHVHYISEGYEPPEPPDFEQLARWGGEAIADYLGDLANGLRTPPIERPPVCSLKKESSATSNQAVENRRFGASHLSLETLKRASGDAILKFRRADVVKLINASGARQGTRLVLEPARAIFHHTIGELFTRWFNKSLTYWAFI